MGQTEMEIETHVAQVMGRAHTKAPEPSLIEPSESSEAEDKTYLLFTTGSLTYSPHQIGKTINMRRRHRGGITLYWTLELPAAV